MLINLWKPNRVFTAAVLLEHSEINLSIEVEASELRVYEESPTSIRLPSLKDLREKPLSRVCILYACQTLGTGWSFNIERSALRSQ